MILENIKRLCDERGMSIYGLEKEMNLGNGTIGKWENSSPRIETVKRIADFFDVSIDDLIKDR